MKTGLNKNEKVLASIALFVITAFFLMFLKLSTHLSSDVTSTDGSNINYQMARPEEAFSDYSLNGRDIDLQYEGLKKKEAVKAAVLAKVKLVAKKKAEEAKKKEEAQKKLAANQLQNKIVNKPTSTKIENDKESTDSTTEMSHNYNDSSQVNYSVDENKNSNSDKKSEKDEEKQKNKKTFAEWRSLIFAKPNRETMALFIDAYRKQEVTETEYQAMSQDLLDQSDENLKGLGILALRAQPSFASFSQLVHIQSSLSSNLQLYTEQAFLTYLQTPYISVLNQSLQVQDKAVVLKSLTLLSSNLPKFNQGDLSGLIDPRNRRDISTASYSANNFRALIPSLTSISTAQDSDLSLLAQQVIGFIQSGSQIAQN